MQANGPWGIWSCTSGGAGCAHIAAAGTARGGVGSSAATSAEQTAAASTSPSLLLARPELATGAVGHRALAAPLPERGCAAGWACSRALRHASERRRRSAALVAGMAAPRHGGCAAARRCETGLSGDRRAGALRSADSDTWLSLMVGSADDARLVSGTALLGDAGAE